MPKYVKRALVMAVDMALCVLSVCLAFYLRLGSWPDFSRELAIAIGVSLVVSIPVFISLGLYRAIFRHAGLTSMIAVLRAVIIASIPTVAILTMVGIAGVPRTVGIIQPILLLLLVVAARAAAHAWLGGAYRQLFGARRGQSVLIYGAGSAGRQLAFALGSDAGMRAVGYVDDDRSLIGRTMNGIPVFKPSDLPGLVELHDISTILLALPSVSRRRRQEILGALRALPVHVQTLPGVADLARGKIQVSDLRELEIEDLLGRETVTPDAVLLASNIYGKVVLVSGAGGSIGSELCRQILALQPSRLVLLDASEFALYSIHAELERNAPERIASVVPLLASVRDSSRVTAIVDTWKPDTIYHAAAYKHVPLVEQNAVEGVRNNVHGTLVMAQAARRFGVSNFVLISTDKAVRPTNVMGASKRIAELVLQAMAAEKGTTCFAIVRFGNVLGSSGSVVPLFRRQIAQGGPVTITDPEITRYFMTIPEAAELVIQAGAMATGGEVFVLDMGQPVKIVDLAKEMIKLSGLTIRDDDTPDGDIDIYITGLRPGEKLYEELLIGDNPEPTRHARILKANETFLPWTRLNAQLRELENALDGGNPFRLREVLFTMVPGYVPHCEPVDLIALERLAS